MARFTVNTQHLDPNENLTFLVKFDGKEIPAVISIIPDNDPALNIFAIEREYTDDPSFKEWMDVVMMLAVQPQGLEDISSITKDVQIEQHDEAGKLVQAWTLRGCRPKRYQPHPARMGQAVDEGAVERLTLLYDDAESNA